MATTTAAFDVKFIEAIAYALNREVVLPDEYYNVMTPIQRQQAVSIAGLAQTEQIKHVMGLVNEQLVDGGTFADFQKSVKACLLYTSPSPRDGLLSRMPSSA